jgi:UDP-N-acetylmuramate: L-alanyl-gamma-D-glutamyl-meso-diaminopimelate ligase
MARNLGVSPENIREAFLTFKGVKRRQEIIGQPKDITIIDDFAHHPTAVAVTIDGVRKRFSRSKIIAVFEPRSATSRRKVFQHDYAKALSLADQVIVSVPYDQSKISEDERFDSQALIDEIKKLTPNLPATVGRSVDEIVASIVQEAVPGNVVLLMSNGGFGGIYQKLLQKFS